MKTLFPGLGTGSRLKILTLPFLSHPLHLTLGSRISSSHVQARSFIGGAPQLLTRRLKRWTGLRTVRVKLFYDGWRLKRRGSWWPYKFTRGRANPTGPANHGVDLFCYPNPPFSRAITQLTGLLGSFSKWMHLRFGKTREGFHIPWGRRRG